MALSYEQRFYCRVAPANVYGCTEWDGCRNDAGYGIFDKQTTHRVAWKLKHGPIPPGLFVLHICDNRACVNTTHLYLGDHNDNMRDLKYKRRRQEEEERRRLKNFDQLMQDIK